MNYLQKQNLVRDSVLNGAGVTEVCAILGLSNINSTVDRTIKEQPTSKGKTPQVSKAKK